MDGTVKISLSDYNMLKKQEELLSMVLDKADKVCYYSYGGYINILTPTEADNKLLSRIKNLESQLNESEVRRIQLERKKWYQIWK